MVHFLDRLSTQKERIILVFVAFSALDLERLGEFRELILSTNGELLAEVIVRRDKPNPKYFVGPGKADELKQRVTFEKADLVIFNSELSPAQERNLEKCLECRVLDRTSLILDIFAQRARTFEGKLQVELAQLQHLATRLVRGWTHLERQKGGIGLRGPGETQLETDRRLVRQRISHIEKRLEKVAQQRAQGRRSRERASMPTVSLVGYTNAGKSTLFNHLTEADVYVADQLFATLDPTLRKIQLPQFGDVILTDTVGFIRDLPHDLVAAFRATLEETRAASLLLHIVDASDQKRHEKITQVSGVLAQIDAQTVRALQVFNKVDLLDEIEPHIDYDALGVPVRVWVSAYSGAGLALLKQAIAECLCDAFVHCSIRLHAKEGSLRSKLYDLDAVVQEFLTEQNEVVLEVRLPLVRYQRLF